MRPLHSSPALPLLGAGALALGLALWIEPGREPILGDRAYFVYLGQAILRGEPIYANTFFGYPPLTPLLSAAAMGIGQWLGVPSHLAPRALGIASYVGCVVLSTALARHATRSTRAGLLAGVVMAGFAPLAALAVADLEPKILLVLFTLAAGVALQQRRHGLAGLACGLAGMCWQPAVLVATAVLAVVLHDTSGRRLRALARYALGMALALVPPLAYLVASDGLVDFWQRAIVVPATLQGGDAASGAWWLVVLRFYWPAELIFVAAAALAWAVFALRAPWRQPGALADHWLSPSRAAMPLLLPLWCAWNTLDFQGPPDLLPLLASVPFWVAWGAAEGLHALASGPRARALATALLLAVAAYALGDVGLHRPGMTLAEERALVADVLAPVGPDEAVVAFDAAEVYVLSERATPLRLLSLNVFFEQALPLIHPEGCRAIRRRLRELRPRVVVINQHEFQGRCVNQLARELPGDGYGSRRVTLAWWRHRAYHPDDAPSDRIRWRVFTRRP